MCLKLTNTNFFVTAESYSDTEN